MVVIIPMTVRKYYHYEITQLNADEYEIRNKKKNVTYSVVNTVRDGLKCNCDATNFGTVICKHKKMIIKLYYNQ